MAELILALDLPDRGSALAMLDRLPALRWVKVGSQLMTAEGPPLVRELVSRGLEVFLDLKWHDIPHTVEGAIAAARGLGVRMATVHTLGGPVMLRAAAQASGDRLAIVGVTVLTSHDEAEYAATLDRPSVRLLDETARLARSAIAAGVRGVVCSPFEVERLRAGLGPEPLIVVPGIRRTSDGVGDQRRTATPREAAAAGATHLVVGRPILSAPDPAAALEEFLSAVQ
ncbi:MAG TPA: orotidine-5'-phosphate decarboxylase [Gemmatimonadales bacterium]|nr:orotidine-5'-phosphate decarboxylase [Gemmatimonadales bacterium]